MIIHVRIAQTLPYFKCCNLNLKKTSYLTWRKKNGNKMAGKVEGTTIGDQRVFLSDAAK